jgi:integrase
MITKRGKVWWARFTVNGERYQLSLETRNKQKAIAEEQRKIAQAESGVLSSRATDFAQLTFAEALKRWLPDRHEKVSAKTSAPLAEKTKQTEWERTVPLLQRLGSHRVSKFTAQLVQNYINERNKVVSPATVNRELDLIRGLLKEAKLWGRMSDQVKSLKLREPIGRAFSQDERDRIERIAGSKPEWRNARLAFTLALNTTMRPVEIKSLQWPDVDFATRTITLRRSKTDAGKRTIPLNGPALEAFHELARDAKLLSGGFLPADWYVMPGRSATQPLTTWRTAWRKILAAAGVKRTRFYDTRHTSITDLLQNPEASEETVKSIAGHVDRRILQRYSHARIEAKRRALETMGKNFRGKSPGTILVQSASSGTPTDS